MSVRDLIQQSGRRWHAHPGASDADLQRLSALSPVALPSLLLDLLRLSNGGEGPLALPPLVFVLDDVDFIVSNLPDPSNSIGIPGFLFFGGNGGLERIALDTRSGEPWPIVMIDPVAGADSAVVIARDFEEFIQAVGRDSHRGA